MSHDGFFKRWSRRKSLQSANSPDVPAPAPTDTAKPQPPAAQTVTSRADPANPLASQPLPKAAPPDTAGSPQPLPSLADTDSLTPASDFKPFMGQGVAPEVKNAAMKKLFADPHFNVMDRMDIYIDDYSQPDPLPLAMLRQMNGSQFLNLFEQENPVSSTALQAAGATDAQLAHDPAPVDDVAKDDSATAQNPPPKA
jgi:Protein of unknown function (DUF3306)